MTSLLVGIGSALGGVYAMRIVEDTFEQAMTNIVRLYGEYFT